MLNVNIYDNERQLSVYAEIIQITNQKLPYKKNGWNFNWNSLKNQDNSKLYALRLAKEPRSIQGLLLLKYEFDMVIMDLVEIAPNNIGSNNKQFEFVAESLIAFACRESFKIDGNYKGFLTFRSKSNLIEMYKNKYAAVETIDRRMYIDDINGIKLIERYLE